MKEVLQVLENKLKEFEAAESRYRNQAIHYELQAHEAEQAAAGYAALVTETKAAIALLRTQSGSTEAAE